MIQNPQPISGPLGGSVQRPETLSNFLLTFPFLLLLWVNLAYHRLWFDEINAWGIAAAAPTLPRLLELVHFEGHPWLWYVILWIPTRFTHDPNVLKWVEGIFGTAIYLVLGLLSPFTRVQKILVFLCYYVAFEYTVMSRMYSVMFLLVLLYVAQRMRKPDKVVGSGILLGLVASTDMTGVLLSGALLLEYAYDRWTAHRATGWTPRQNCAAWLGVAVYVLLLGISVHSVIPSPQISWQASGHIGSGMFQPRRIVQSIGNLSASPWWPISRQFPERFWGTDAIQQKKLLLLAPFVLLAYWRTFRRERNLLLLMALTLGFGMLFADVVYDGRVRHWGIVFISFLVGLWMQTAERQRRGEATPTRWSPWAYALISLGALSGVTALASSWTHPFSQASNTAEWIRTHEPRDVPLVGEWDLAFASVGEELQRPMYFMECACMDTFKLFARDRDEFSTTEFPSRLTRAMEDLHSSHLLLVNWMPLTPEDFARLHGSSFEAAPLATFTGSDEGHENYYLYWITRR